MESAKKDPLSCCNSPLNSCIWARLGSEASLSALSFHVLLCVCSPQSRIFSVYCKIYLFSLYAYIHYYFCTDMDKWVHFFSTKGAIIMEAFSHTSFACVAQNWFVPHFLYQDSCYGRSTVLL